MRSISGILRKNNRKIVGKRSLRCETLEDRRVLATFTVINTNDAGAGSLRQAILDANAMAGPDMIDFAPALGGATINLTTGTLSITDSVNIDGPANKVTVSGPGDVVTGFRIFSVNDNAPGLISVAMDDLNITGGNAKTEATPDDSAASNQQFRRGGAIDSRENLRLERVMMTNNFGRWGGALGLSGHLGTAAAGGLVVIRDSVITGNSANDKDLAGTADIGRGGAMGAFNTPDIRVYSSRLDNNFANFLGGAIETRAGTGLKISDSTISGNTTFLRGAAMYNAERDTALPLKVELNRVVVASNTVTASDSAQFGAITIGQGGDVIISDSTIRDNVGSTGVSRFSSGIGGANTDPSSNLTITDSTISGNSIGGVGGGLLTGFDYNTTPRGSVNISRSTISNNGLTGGVPDTYAGGGIQVINDGTGSITESIISGNASRGNGGGVLAYGNANLQISKTTIRGNTALGYGGGGLAAVAYGTATVTRSTISGNFSDTSAGGVQVLGGATLRLEQSTISGNTTNGAGGGLLAYADSGQTTTVTLEGSTLTGNASDAEADGTGNGGGLWAAAYVDVAAPGTTAVSLSNTIVSGNSDPTAGSSNSPDVYDYASYYGGGVPTSITARFSFIGNNENSPFAEANPDANGNKVGGLTGGVLNAMLGALADNGGPTRTHLPAAGSPVINMGDPAVVGGMDQRMLNRVFGGRVDMGSVEVQPTGPDADFNDDGLLNCVDIDALTNAVAMGGPVATFDLNGDGSLSILDVDKWRADAGAVNLGAGRVYRVGDANLDGGVDGSDFGIWNANKFTANKDWCRGNFNADTVTDGSDFGLWNANKFTSADAGRSATAGGLIQDDVAPVGGQSAAARVRGAGKLSAEVKSKKPAVAAAREEGGVARRVQFAPPTAAAIESKTETTKVSLRAEETKVVALPTVNTSVNSGSDSARNSTSRLLKKVASHDNFFSMFGAQ
jgi:hypothetical protein